jgi:hypothetical protein
MSDPIDPAYHLKWFYEHCAAHHYLSDIATPMLDVAVAIMHHIHQLTSYLYPMYRVRWEGGHPRLHLVLSVSPPYPGSRKLPRRTQGMLDEPHCLCRGRRRKIQM